MHSAQFSCIDGHGFGGEHTHILTCGGRGGKGSACDAADRVQYLKLLDIEIAKSGMVEHPGDERAAFVLFH